ncbi:HAD family hydrolase [Kiloniella litopenaei]|uniref:phosphoglycolate phosphatase n=1 Tax=Kiloniella litopenaei TaxID=1549748 RepID=A0A0M2R7J1_9PROT|nr:HAD-IA family hydrolase [Kiloniella litopenaei]KKJ75483.1 HAD family hydrolase [Kiloniella litopenaei]
MTSSLPKAIVFDWDNTLIDSWISIHHALSVTFEEMGMIPWTLEEAKDRVRASARESFPKIFGDKTEAATRVFYDTYEARHLDVLTPLPHAKELLEFLVSKGIYLSIVSNKKGYILRKEVSKLGWDIFFQNIIGANDAEKDKPDPMVMDLALMDSGIISDKHVWFVGDTDIDLQCAHNSTCYPVLIRPEPPKNDEFIDCKPALHFRSCSEMQTFLSSKR